MIVNCDERQQNNYNILRLLAAIFITFSHSFDLLKLSEKEPLNQISSQTIQFSFIGLCIFFSCSGYLIAKSACTSFSFKNYIWKRFLRIQPLLIVWCFIAIFIIGFLFTSLSSTNYFTNNDTWAYLKTIFPAWGIRFSLPQVFTNNIAENGVNGSLWSLVIEERLYLLIALVFLFRSAAKTFFISIIVLLNVVYYVSTVSLQGQLLYNLNTSSSFYSMVFLNASLLYFLRIEFSKSISALLFCSFILLVGSFFGLEFLKVITIPVFIIAVSQIKSITNRVGKYGDFTYGIYIFSFPTQQILIANKCVSNPFVLFFSTLLIVLPLAIISWHLLEKRMMRLKNKY